MLDFRSLVLNVGLFFLIPPGASAVSAAPKSDKNNAPTPLSNRDRKENAKAKSESQAKKKPVVRWQSPLSLAYFAPTQLYPHVHPFAAVSFEYHKASYYSHSPAFASRDETMGPSVRSLFIFREESLPLVVGFDIAMGREKGSRYNSNARGSLHQRHDKVSISLTYSINKVLAVALGLEELSRSMGGDYYANRYFFSWQQYSLGVLFHKKKWDVGLLFGPGILNTGHNNNETVSFGKPPLWTVHSSYLLQEKIVLSARLTFLINNNLVNASDQSWRNQLSLMVGTSLQTQPGDYEVALLFKNHAYERLDATSARKTGEHGIRLGLTKPFLEHGRWGLRFDLITQKTSLSQDNQDWVLTANKRSFLVFAGWTFGTDFL